MHALNHMIFSLNVFQNLVEQIAPGMEKLQKAALLLKVI